MERRLSAILGAGVFGYSRLMGDDETDSGPPVGYWADIADPDGNNLEVSYGQPIGFTVEHDAVKF